MPNAEREVNGGYVGDLLSWVMGRAPADCAWVTIMSNINVAAVASLADGACVILAEGVALDEDALAKAEREGINILSMPDGAYEICAKVSALL
jgi:acyl-coenzyme A synthetase/AMP-(fatty) acid ligase